MVVDRFTKVIAAIAASLWGVHGAIEGKKAWSSGQLKWSSGQLKKHIDKIRNLFKRAKCSQ